MPPQHQDASVRDDDRVGPEWTDRAGRAAAGDRSDRSVLVVGTLGGGGIHRYVDEQRRHLAGMVDVDVYDMYSDPGGAGPRWFLRSLLRSVLAALAFPFGRDWRHPLRARPDLVHVHTSHRYSFVRAAFYVLFAARVWRRPVVLHVHGSSFDDFLEAGPWLGRLQSLVFDASDAVVVLSAYWEDTLAGTVDPDKLVVLPNAVVPAEYDPAFGVEPPRVVFVSNLIPRKGVAELVTAVDRLCRESDLEFTVAIAGSGPMAGAVERLAHRHAAVEYHGYLPEADKRALLDGGSIFVLPTYAEGLPIAMLEGMAGGNAIVSTDVGAIPEVVGSDSGVLVEPGDAAGLADALAELLADPESVERMGRANRRAVEQRYSWDAATATLRSVYEAVLAGQAPATVGREGGEVDA